MCMQQCVWEEAHSRAVRKEEVEDMERGSGLVFSLGYVQTRHLSFPQLKEGIKEGSTSAALSCVVLSSPVPHQDLEFLSTRQQRPS